MKSRLRVILRMAGALALTVIPVALTGCSDDVFPADVAGVDVLPASSGGDGAAGPASSPVYTFPGGPDQTLIEGASAHIVRTKNGVNFRVDTNSLMPGHAYTLWVVIFNEPDQCLTAPGTCTPADLFHPAAKPDMLYGAGTVVGGSGQATLAGRTQVGDVSGSVQAPVGLFSNGLIDPFGAEFHLVVHNHGPVIPEFMPDMIHSLAGGCTDAGIPSQGAPSPWNDYAVSPAYGQEFGRLGPNACLSVQYSILRPSKGGTTIGISPR